MSKNTIEPPPYETVMRDGIHSDRTGIAPTQAYARAISYGLNNQLNTSRTQRINTTISDHIEPLIRHRARMGLSRTVIVLLPVPEPPAKILTTTNHEDDSNEIREIIDIVSSHTDSDSDDLHQIHLPIEFGSTKFWSQDSVLDELKVGLKEKLTSTGPDATNAGLNEKNVSAIRAERPNGPSPANMESQTTNRTRTKPKSRGLFSWKSSSPQPSNAQLETDKSSDNTEDMATIGHLSGTNASDNHILVDVIPDEVCFRTQSSLGIYDTETRSAVVVKVRVIGRFDAGRT